MHASLTPEYIPYIIENGVFCNAMFTIEKRERNKGKQVNEGYKKGFTAIMLCFLAFTWLMSAVRAEAASAPALEFIYADTSSEAGIERGKLIIASFQTGGQSITGAELTYEDRTGDTGRMAATEILEGYVAFLAQDRDLSGERLKELRIGYGAGPIRLIFKISETPEVPRWSR